MTLTEHLERASYVRALQGITYSDQQDERRRTAPAERT